MDREQIEPHLDSKHYSATLTAANISTDNIDPDVEVVSVFADSHVTKEMIEQMPNLQLLACRSTGFNNIDLDAAFEHGIAVVNVPNYGSNTVAEYAFAMLLTLSRKLPQVMEQTRAGHLRHEDLRGTDLAGKTLGIIGTGKIGLKMAEIAKGFGMKLRGYDPYPNHAQANKLGLTYSSLTELVEYSDVISLHAPYSKENHHLIDVSVLARCKPGAILINTARGELVDTKALVLALQENQLAAAGLDVLEDEQLMDHSEEMLLLRADHVDDEKLQHSLEISTLERMPNVIVTKHNAFNTIEAVSRINDTTLQNINNFYNGQTSNQVGKTHGKLVIVRHTESEWNAMSKWTGTTDVHLTTKGIDEAKMVGDVIRDVEFDKVFISEQVRTKETAEAVLEQIGQKLNLTMVGEINERDYGKLTGKNKWDIRDKVGEEEFNGIRRGWNHPIEDGETLKTVYERAVPFYKDTIVPLVKEGQNVLLVGHGNSIRSLMKYIETISDEQIEDTEMIFGTALIYTIDKQGRMRNKQIRTIDSAPPPSANTV